MKETTLVLPIDGDPPRRVLLGLKKEGFGAGKITGFGGKVEPDETPAMAAGRELKEETGIMVSDSELCEVGELCFCFPRRPVWNQLVHVFIARRWTGIPQEGREMRPSWYGVHELPYDQMWQDASYWLPRFVAGERIRGQFVFDGDNETVLEAVVEAWVGD